MSSQNWQFLTPSLLLVVFLQSKIGNFWPPPLPPWDDIVYGQPLRVNILKFYVKPKNVYLIQIHFRQKASSINQELVQVLKKIVNLKNLWQCDSLSCKNINKLIFSDRKYQMTLKYWAQFCLEFRQSNQIFLSSWLWPISNLIFNAVQQ